MPKLNSTTSISIDLYHLTVLQSNLESIIAAITQQPEKKLRKARYVGRFIGGKVAGVTAMSLFYSAVATFGTASTGTAIGTLSGAAATNATLYWIGGLVGGGVAAGTTVMTFGAAAIGAGAVLAWNKFFKTKPRKLTDLLSWEKRILCSCDILLRSLEPQGKLTASSLIEMSRPEERHLFSKYGIAPLLKELDFVQQSDTRKKHLKENLMRKNRNKLTKAHNRLRWWSDGFSRTYPRKPTLKSQHQHKKSAHGLIGFLKRMFKRKRLNQEAQPPEVNAVASSAIFMTFHSFLEKRNQPINFEQSLVLDALRRAETGLNSASTEHLAEYIRALSPERLSHLVSQTKREFHKHLLSHSQEKRDPAFDVEQALAQCAPGYDIEYALQDNCIRRAQISDKTSLDLLHEHLGPIPQKTKIASDVFIALINGLGSDGFRSYVTNFKAIQRLVEFKSDGFVNSITDELASSVYVIAAATVHSLLVEKSSPEEALNDALVIAGIIAVGDGISGMVSDFFGLP